MSAPVKEIAALNEGYKYGFVTEIETEQAPPGLDEDTVRFISAKKGEPEWLLDWRLEAFRAWQTMISPDWAKLNVAPIDYQAATYWSAPKSKDDAPKSLDEVDPELLAMYEKLGVPMREREALAGVQVAGVAPRNVAIDAVFDSVSVTTTFKEELSKHGISSSARSARRCASIPSSSANISVPWCRRTTISSPRSIRPCSGDGSFRHIPKGVRCPMELSTYFRINAAKSGQFERTLLIADKGAYVSYLEGCTAPQRDENQLHAAVVELIAHEDAQIKYSTVQNWYPGDAEGRGGIYNFVTKRGDCRGRASKISWTQVETGSAITWKYPSCLLEGDDSVGEFYSVAITNNRQQADTGTKMIHIGRNSSSTVISKGISAGRGQNTYRGLVRMQPRAENARNYTQCDSLLIGDRCGAHTVPYIEVRNPTAKVEHEATTSKISDDQMFYCRSRGPQPGRRAVADRQRLLQRGLQRTADGVRRRGAKAAQRKPGRQRRMMLSSWAPPRRCASYRDCAAMHDQDDGRSVSASPFTPVILKTPKARLEGRRGGHAVK